jgi:RNA polymerase sigma-70 factor (ECF subfamily)
VRFARVPTPEEVVREHGPSVHRHLRRIFGPQADVDDVFQIVFVEVLRSLPSFKGRSKLSTWIRRITWNVAYQEMRMQYRAARSTVFDEEYVGASSRCEAEDSVARLQAMRRLYAGLETLDPKQRMAVLMHDVEGMTLKEIGKALGRPLQTVASQLHTGRRKLAAAMRGETEEQAARQPEEGRRL